MVTKVYGDFRALARPKNLRHIINYLEDEETGSARAPGVRNVATKGGRPKAGSVADRRGSRPISRVLSRTAIPLGTRSPACSSDLPGGSASRAVAPYAVLLRMGFTLPSVLPRTRCALTAPFHPCQPRGAYGGVFSVALSVASRRPAVNRHPALWSPDFPLHTLGVVSSGCLADFPLLRLARLRTFSPGSPDLWLRLTCSLRPACKSAPQYGFTSFRNIVVSTSHGSFAAM